MVSLSNSSITSAVWIALEKVIAAIHPKYCLPNVLPTRSTIMYASMNFLQNDADTYDVFPDYYYSSNRSRDSLTVIHLQNDFSYSFTFRPKKY